MKKLYILILIICSIALPYNVKAYNGSYNSGAIEYLADSYDANEQTCKESFLGDPNDSVKKQPAYYLQIILDIIKYLGIVICIVLTCFEFFKALFSEDTDAMKPLVKKAFTRLILVAMLFFLPIIVKMLMTFVGAYGTCGIE